MDIIHTGQWSNSVNEALGKADQTKLKNVIGRTFTSAHTPNVYMLKYRQSTLSDKIIVTDRLSIRLIIHYIVQLSYIANYSPNDCPQNGPLTGGICATRPLHCHGILGQCMTADLGFVRPGMCMRGRVRGQWTGGLLYDITGPQFTDTEGFLGRGGGIHSCWFCLCTEVQSPILWTHT